MGGLGSDALHGLYGTHVVVGDGAAQLVDGQRAEDKSGRVSAHNRHREEQLEEVALLGGKEAEEVVGVLKDLLMHVEAHLFLLADGGEGVERDVDAIADALVVQDDVCGRLFGYFARDVGVHLGAVWIKLQK